MLLCVCPKPKNNSVIALKTAIVSLSIRDLSCESTFDSHASSSCGLHLSHTNVPTGRRMSSAREDSILAGRLNAASLLG